MITYRAPLEDIRFLLHRVFDYEGRVASLPGYEDASGEIVDAVLEEAERFAVNELLPLNASGDAEGCVFENGVVRTPEGFKEAYRAFSEAGWCGLSCDPDYGGQGLPHTLQFLINEMICSTNLSFGMYPGLSHGAYNALALHGSKTQKNHYLPQLVAGTWSGTMCLTEPHCGTDLGLIRTRAEPDGVGPDGETLYKITGTKIFISAGEHDLTDNIVHLVLAKLPDAPPGVRGISMFLVPKILVTDDGSLGERNAAVCGSIEQKMGIKASSTCVMNFDAARGTLVGAPHKGMRYMFTMMNEARLAVGLQGLGIAETAYQSAAAYAKERRQGRALKGAAEPDKAADPIIVHPDVRKNLLTMRALNEGTRALAVWTAINLDVSTRHPDAATRQECDDLISLLTPIIKAFMTDHGFTAANLGVQIFGGHGFIRETGMEQLVRDARITQLYEGAYGIQGLDLVGRKLPQHAGRLLRRFFHPVAAFIEANMAEPGMQDYMLPLAKAFAKLQQASVWIAQEGMRDPNQGAAAASNYLRLFALVILAYLWARMAEVALAVPEDQRDDFHKAKLATARFYMTYLLPEANSLFTTITAGAGPLMDPPAEWF